MPWVISFIVSWVLFFILVDYKALKRNIFGGILALILASLIDWGGQKLGLYDFYNVIIPWAGCSAFYKFGPVLVMGIIFVQCVPDKRRLKVLNIIVTSMLFILLELAVISTGVAKYFHWSIFASIIVDILALTSLTWIAENFIKRKSSG